MGGIRKIRAIIAKDILLEFRAKEVFLAMLLLAILLLVILHFSLKVSSGIIWIAFIFAGILGLNHSISIEKENRTFEGLLLAPLDKGSLYLGKMLANFIFMLLLEVIILLVFSVFFQVNIFSCLFSLLLVCFLATLGFVALGTLFAGLALRARLPDLLLSVILYPLILPVILSAVKITEKIFEGGKLVEIGSWLNMLIVFDVVFVIVSYLTFEYIISE